MQYKKTLSKSSFTESLKRKHDQSDGDERERVTLRKVDRSKQLYTSFEKCVNTGIFRQNSRLLDDLPPPSKEPPKFQSQLKSLTLNEGQHALLDCKFGPTDDANLKVRDLQTEQKARF